MRQLSERPRQTDLPNAAWAPPYARYHDLIIECALERPAKVGAEYELRHLFQAMRIRIPVPGMQWDRVIAVASGPGCKVNAIAEHSHPEYICLYHVEPTSEVIIAGEPMLPDPGDFLIVRPGVSHSVRESVTRRVVVAMLVSEVQGSRSAMGDAPH